MVGAHAQALDDLLVIDTNELDDARWFSREEVIAALDGDPAAPFSRRRRRRSRARCWSNGSTA